MYLICPVASRCNTKSSCKHAKVHMELDNCRSECCNDDAESFSHVFCAAVRKRRGNNKQAINIINRVLNEGGGD